MLSVASTSSEEIYSIRPPGNATYRELQDQTGLVASTLVSIIPVDNIKFRLINSG